MLEKINKNLKLFIIVAAVLIVVSAAIYVNKGADFFRIFQKQNSGSESSLDSFAKCLSEKGIKFYGAWWCPYCQNQKEMFGDSFQYVNYIECEKEPEKSRGNVVDACLQAEIEVYPTWDFPGGEKQFGEVPLAKLSELSGCPLK